MLNWAKNCQSKPIKVFASNFREEIGPGDWRTAFLILNKTHSK